MATTHTKELRNYVGGEWITPRTTEYLDVTNPATGDLLGRVPLSNRADVDQAVAAAQAAFPAWRATPPLDRARYLFFRPRADGGAVRDVGASGHAGAWQIARRCPRLGATRNRKRRGRQRHSLPAHGLRTGGRRGQRHRRGRCAAAARSVCGHLSLQLPADGPLLVLAIMPSPAATPSSSSLPSRYPPVCSSSSRCSTMRGSRRASSTWSTAPKTP